jgi:NAD(P)H-hydrate repair Nnr-like enzyme with NAD(P)H-hydrate dehydratase domain
VTLEDAARLGVALHSASADIAVQHTGERSLLASDLIEAMISLLAGA